MSVAAIHYQPKYPPIRAKADCKCGGEHALVVGGRIDGKGAKAWAACDATICMACGTIKPFAEYRHYHDALADFWKEHGWNRTIGMRLTEFADLTTSNPFESYAALQAGLSPEEAAAYSRAAPDAHANPMPATEG